MLRRQAIVVQAAEPRERKVLVEEDDPISEQLYPCRTDHFEDARYPPTSSRIRAAFLKPMPRTCVKLSSSAVTTRSTEPNLINSR